MTLLTGPIYSIKGPLDELNNEDSHNVFLREKNKLLNRGLEDQKSVEIFTEEYVLVLPVIIWECGEIEFSRRWSSENSAYL